MQRDLPRRGAVFAASVLAVALMTPAFAQNALDSAAALQQQLDLSALAAHGKAQPVEGRLTPAQAAALKSLGRNYGRTGNQAALMQGWQGYLASNRPPPGDIDAIVALVMREAYLQSSADLKQQVEQVRAANRQKARLREQAKGTVTLQLAPGTLQLQPPGAVVGENDAKLNTTGEDGQLANLDLQAGLQRYQQTLQTMSNVSKMMHDAAMGVIRRMK